MSKQPKTTANGQVENQHIENAAAWVVRLQSDQVVGADEVESDAWRKAAAANEAEYQAQENLWNAVGRLADSSEARAILMRPKTEQSWSPSRRAALGMLAGGAAAASAAFAVFSGTFESGQIYRTARGQRQTVPLEDGSTLVLNTDSQVRVSLLRTERHVFLDRGQTFFEVAKDAQRPFRVFADGHEVKAIGTAFDVYRNGTATLVTLEEGAVAVYRDQPTILKPTMVEWKIRLLADRPSAVLKAGQRATLDVSAPIEVMDTDLKVSEAWRDGRIVFDEMPLHKAIEDVNRYQQRQIIFADPALGDYVISGVFHTNCLEAFVEALIATFPVRIERESDAAVILAAR